MKTYRRKYGNKTSRYKDRLYHSRLEATDAMWLDSLLKQGLIKEVIPQHKISIDINGVHITNHFVDFKVTLNDGRVKMIETKGFWTDIYKFKLRLIQAIYPEMVYLVKVIVPSDQIEEGRKRAEDLKMMIHPEEYLTFRDLQNIHYGMALQYLRDLMSSQ